MHSGASKGRGRIRRGLSRTGVRFGRAAGRRSRASGARGSRSGTRGGKRISASTLPPQARSIEVTDSSFCYPFSHLFCPIREPGPHIPAFAQVCPLPIFEYFFDKVMDRILNSTLAYAEHKKNSMPSSYEIFY